MHDPKSLLLITGFLGSGKTTLVRKLLSEFFGRGIGADVILNDILNADLDAASIDPGHASSVASLAASCACCESLSELVALCRTAVRGDGDMLLIELNGTADPLGMLESFSILKEELPFFPMLHVCVIDPRRWGRRGELTRLEKRQMEGAGLHVLSHTDQAESVDLRRVEAALASRFPESRQVTAKQLADALISRVPVPVSGGLRMRASEPAALGTKNKHDEIHLLSHQVKGVQVPLPESVRRVTLERLLNRLPDNVLRAKALVVLTGEPRKRWLLERSGTDVSPSPIPIPGVTRLSPSLLCMGLQLDEEQLRALVSETFGNVPARDQ